MRLILAFSCCLSLFATSVLTGCSGKLVDENDPASLYKDAEEEIQGEHYQIALDKLRVIKNKFPYSKYSVEAQLRIADVYYLQESWAEAASSYESFRDLHPKNEKVPYAMFRVGESYFNDIPGNVARDLSPAQKAVESFDEFLHRFPNDPQAKTAREHLASARQSLAAKELYIGNFYLKQGQPEAAKPRLQKVIELYPDTEAAKEAKQKKEQK